MYQGLLPSDWQMWRIFAYGLGILLATVVSFWSAIPCWKHVVVLVFVMRTGVSKETVMSINNTMVSVVEALPCNSYESWYPRSTKVDQFPALLQSVIPAGQSHDPLPHSKCGCFLSATVAGTVAPYIHRHFFHWKQHAECAECASSEVVYIRVWGK